MGTPTSLRWLFASHLHQPTKLPRPFFGNGKAWHGVSHGDIEATHQRPATFHHQQHATPTKAPLRAQLGVCSKHNLEKKQTVANLNHAAASFLFYFFFQNKNLEMF